MMQKNLTREIDKLLDYPSKIEEQGIEELKFEIIKLENQLTAILSEPQSSFPDVMLWMYADKEPTGYARIPVEELVATENSRGGLVRTVLLRTLKSKRGRYQDLIKAKLEIRLWMGHEKDRYLENNPVGVDYSLMESTPPSHLHYKEPNTYTLRAYLYQGRTVLGSDNSGLSDPFVRLIFSHHIAKTRVIDQTRSPVWDQMFSLDNIVMCQNPEELRKYPPAIIINVFDQDEGNDEEFLGQAVAVPFVIGPDDRSKHKPELAWFPITIGEKRYGEILACFELYSV